MSYSISSLGLRRILRNRVGDGSSGEKKQAESLAPGRKEEYSIQGIGPGQRKWTEFQRGLRPTWAPLKIFFQYILVRVDPIFSGGNST